MCHATGLSYILEVDHAPTFIGGRLLRPKTRSWLAVAFGLLAAAYMLFESQWLRRERLDLRIADLPSGLEGMTVLHLSDVHAGQPGLNIRTFAKAVRWSTELRPDLIVLTGDILGGRAGWGRCLPLLRLLEAPLGTYAVPGNHEYGLSKNPLTHPPEPIPWEACGVRLLRDACVTLEVSPGDDATEHDPEGSVPGRWVVEAVQGEPSIPGSTTRLCLCGADHLSGGAPLLDDDTPSKADFAVLLVHRPPAPDDPLGSMFDLAFAGHTHGGQIRVPTPRGLASLHSEDLPYLEGVHRWGRGLLAISAGIGATFVPFRLFTRPQAVLYRLTAGPPVTTDAAPSDIY
jgi:predicted MPP superfamily phosphohydrolase